LGDGVGFGDGDGLGDGLGEGDLAAGILGFGLFRFMVCAATRIALHPSRHMMARAQDVPLDRTRTMMALQ
jgi:hypothetical protein